MYKYLVYILFVSLFSFSKGQSVQELQRLRNEYENYKKTQNKINIQNDEFSDINQQISLPRIERLGSRVEISDSLDRFSDYYGYNFFARSDSISFWDNLPIPSNYVIGAGDELIILLWGETQLRKTYIITKDGTIYDEKVGLLVLNGKSINQAQEYLKLQFGRVYSTLIGSNPSTYMDLSIGRLRSINVNFVGNVNYPGVYPIHPFSNLITGLYQAGGIDTTGSLRDIKIRRNGRLYKSIDLYKYFIKGDTSSIVQLRDQDIIVIPPRLSTIFLDSAIHRSGIYESKSGETVKDLINYAGGLTYKASGIISIERNNSISYYNNDNENSIYINHKDSDKVDVANGDKIFARSIFLRQNNVEITGQVKVPGKYNFYNNMHVNDLLILAGGFKDSTFIKSINLNQAEIIRRNPYSRYEEVIPIDLKKIINGQSNFKLHNLDRVVIHANENYFQKEYIMIYGEVKVPGAYPIIYDNESLKSIIKRAGGLTPSAMENGISIYRNNKDFSFGEVENLFLSTEDKSKLDNPRVRVAWENENITLLPGDSIVVKQKTNTVFVGGAVYNPGILEYNRGKSVNYYINAAGGLTEFGNKSGIMIVYANGSVKPARGIMKPKISEGCTIFITEKPPAEPLNITQFATNWTSIISSMFTAIVLSKQINN